MTGILVVTAYEESGARKSLGRDSDRMGREGRVSRDAVPIRQACWPWRAWRALLSGECLDRKGVSARGGGLSRGMHVTAATGGRNGGQSRQVAMSHWPAWHC